MKKVNHQTTTYINSLLNTKKNEKNKNNADRQKGNNFDWLILNTKNEMLKSKLKTKLVQTINEFKNEKKLR